MQLIELMKRVDAGYPGGDTEMYHDEKGVPVDGVTGDSLAEFVVRAIYEGFEEAESDAEQLFQARKAIRRAFADLNSVMDALETR